MAGRATDLPGVLTTVAVCVVQKLSHAVLVHATLSTIVVTSVCVVIVGETVVLVVDVDTCVLVEVMYFVLYERFCASAARIEAPLSVPLVHLHARV